MSKENKEIDKRKAKRRHILDSFSFFAVVPKKGIHRLKVEDLSELGLGFCIDETGEAHTDFPVKSGDVLDVNLYFNQSLFLPLRAKIVRVEERNAVRRIGAELSDKGSASQKALTHFMGFLDQLIDAAQLK
jgi:hypothetical protein